MSHKITTINECEILSINNAHASADIAMLGATVMSYIPAGQKDLLWLGKHNTFESGRAIRGGIPICWPRFAEDPLNDHLPRHGFARSTVWRFRGTLDTPDDGTTAIFALPPQTSFAANLMLSIHVGKNLALNLTTTAGDKTITFADLFHTYFAVDDICRCKVSAAKKNDNWQAVCTDKPIDTIFESKANLILDDGRRKIKIEKENCDSTVIWNPYGNIGSEVQGDEYRGFVCVEAGNIGNNAITLRPGQSHVSRCIISHTR